MENVSPLLNEVGDLVTKDTENAEVTNDLNDGTECILSKFADDRKPGVVADTPDSATFRGTQKGWRNEQTGTSYSSTKGMPSPASGEEQPYAPVYDGG